MSSRNILIVTFFIGLFAIGFLGFDFFLFSNRAIDGKDAPSTKVIIVEISKGMGPSEVAQKLESSGVIRSQKRLLWLGRVLKQWKKMKAGEYRFTSQMTPLEIFSMLSSGQSITYPITVHEGDNIHLIAKQIEEKGLAKADAVLALCHNKSFMVELGFEEPLPVSLEGYLFPDTYLFNRTLSVKDMLHRMFRRFLTTWDENLQKSAEEMGFTRHQVVILASIIEKETGAPEERPMISSVFHNRLKIKMKLQSDPTSIYGVWENYKGNITKDDLKNTNPFNTYKIKALPIGPISNPGREALMAALHPSDSENLFFVSRNDGTHLFTKSYDDHRKGIRSYQLNESARKGKSWRDRLKKNKEVMAPAGQ